MDTREPIPCPRCERPNGLHRVACLYCGADLPVVGEDGPAPEGDREDLEAHFEAMIRGSGSLDSPQPVPTEGREGKPSPNPPGFQEARDTDEKGPEGESPMAHVLLADLGSAQELENEPISLSGFRRPWLLVVDSGGGDERVEPLARSLGLDGVTAGMIARSSWWRVARWGDSKEELLKYADLGRRSTGLRISVISTEALSEMESPRGVLGAEEDGRLVLTEPGWRGEEEQEGELSDLRLEDFTLAVPGRIVIRRYRLESKRDRWSHRKGQVQRELGERRLSVVDLYGDAGAVRLVAGVTDFTGLPGHFEGSGARSFAAFLEALEPRTELLGRRTCQPQHAAPMAEDETSPDRTRASGWPIWEEHSRICSLHRSLRE